MVQDGTPTHEIERQGRWKWGGAMVGRYTRGEVGRVSTAAPVNVVQKRFD